MKKKLNVSGLFARVHVHHGDTRFALDVAAPDETAEASLHFTHHLGVVASAAAEEVAAIRPRRILVADTT